MQNQKIIDLISTISGELFYAILNHTIISSSTEKDSVEYDEDMVERALKVLKIRIQQNCLPDKYY